MVARRGARRARRRARGAVRPALHCTPAYRRATPGRQHAVSRVPATCGSLEGRCWLAWARRCRRRRRPPSSMTALVGRPHSVGPAKSGWQRRPHTGTWSDSKRKYRSLAYESTPRVLLFALPASSLLMMWHIQKVVQHKRSSHLRKAIQVNHLQLLRRHAVIAAAARNLL